MDKTTFQELVAKYRSNAIQNAASFKRANYYVLLLSEGGIMRRANGCLQNMVINDGESRLVTSNDREFISDTSSVTFVDNQEFQLPTRVTEIPITRVTFKLAKNSPVALNYEMLGDGSARDVWFDIDDSFANNVMAMEDVDTFLRQ